MLTTEEEEGQGVNAQEEKELRRVFDHLAFYREKLKRQQVLAEKKERKSQLSMSKRMILKSSSKSNGKGMPSNMSQHSLTSNGSSSALVAIDANGNRMTEDQIDEDILKLEADVEKKQQEYHALLNSPVKAIRHEDLFDAIKALGKSCSRKEISDMIWEADENLDSTVDWEELKAMFNRNLKDKTNLEPVNLFNVIQFMTYDKKLCGTITADDTMAILFARYGRAQLEPRMKQLFGKSDELSFVDYLQRVSKRSRKEQSNSAGKHHIQTISS